MLRTSKPIFTMPATRPLRSTSNPQPFTTIYQEQQVPLDNRAIEDVIMTLISGANIARYPSYNEMIRTLYNQSKSLDAVQRSIQIINSELCISQNDKTENSFPSRIQNKLKTYGAEGDYNLQDNLHKFLVILLTDEMLAFLVSLTSVSTLQLKYEKVKVSLIPDEIFKAKRALEISHPKIEVEILTNNEINNKKSKITFDFTVEHFYSLTIESVNYKEEEQKASPPPQPVPNTPNPTPKMSSNEKYEKLPQDPYHFKEIKEVPCCDLTCTLS